MKFYLPLLLLLATGCGSKNESPAPAPAPVTGPFTQAYVGYEHQGFADVPVTIAKALSATPAASWSSTKLSDATHQHSAAEFHKAVSGETMTVTVTIPRFPARVANSSHFIWVPFYANKGALATDNTKPLARDQARDILPQEIKLYEADIMNAANYGPNGYVVTRTVILP